MRAPIILMGLLLHGAAAWAVEIQIISTDEQSQQTTTIQLSGEEITSLHAVTREGVKPQTCTNAPSGSMPIATVKDSLRGELLYMDYPRALQMGEKALGAMACQEQAVNVANLQEVYFLLGVAAARNEEVGRAKNYFQRAITLPPKLVWDEDLGEEGRSTFETAHGLQTTQTVFQSEDRSLLVDGRPMEESREMTLMSGVHLVQWPTEDGGVTGVVVDTTGHPKITFIRTDLFDWTRSDQLQTLAYRRRLSHILATWEGSNKAVQVVYPNGRWSGQTGSEDWVYHETNSQRTHLSKRMLRASPGVGLTLAGGAVWLSGWTKAHKAVKQQCAATTMDEYTTGEQQLQRARTQARIGTALMGVGTVGALIGGLLPTGKNIQARPYVGAHTLGLNVHVQVGKR
jgi:hypothetical protein